MTKRAEAKPEMTGLSRVVRKGVAPIPKDLSAQETMILRAREEERARLSVAGIYRVIHGSICLPRPIEEWRNADGSEKPGEAKQIVANMGDEVFLDAQDAYLMRKAGVVEDLDTKPSRVGKVFTPPETMPNQFAPIG